MVVVVGRGVHISTVKRVVVVVVVVALVVVVVVMVEVGRGVQRSAVRLESVINSLTACPCGVIVL